VKLGVKLLWQSDHLEIFDHEGLELSIVGGCWVHPSAAPILARAAEKSICYLLLDTTWVIMRQYITAILMIISHNTALPLAFSFGPIED
jgi:hypothetical protein